MRESAIKKRSVVISGRKTSVSLEDEFWEEAKLVAAEQDVSLFEFVQNVADAKGAGNVSSAVRLAVLEFFVRASKADESDTEAK